MSKSITQEILKAYNSTRYTNDLSNLCHAPFNNMYFNIHGQAAACWNTFWGAPTWPENSIHDIWFGDYFNKLRENIQKLNLSEQCYVCEGNILSGNHMATLARAYDNHLGLTKYPRIMEFELSNKCNYECIMCRGELSSMIRKNREKLPPLISPYSVQFAEELKEFIPHLVDMRFNGGEPFLHDLCYTIFDHVAELNPEVEITVATNGSLWTKKVKDTLEKCKFRINVSIDSLDKDNYEAIRIHGNFDRLMNNVNEFSDYCKRNDRIFSVMINPMRQNWWEMPKFVHWCNENDHYLWFNTIVDPEHTSLMKWDRENLKEVYETLSKDQGFKVKQGSKYEDVHASNIEKYNNLVENMIKVWAQNAPESA